MLVITRHAGESLLIGDDIEIHIVEVQGDKVKIGIVAPRDIRILRRELLDEVRTTNEQAADVSISLEALASAVKASELHP